MSPLSAHADEFGHLNAVDFEKLVSEEGRWKSSGQTINVPLRSLYVAAGTSPNTIYQSEYPDTFVMDKNFFQRHEPEWTNGAVELVPMADEAFPKLGKPAPLTSYQKTAIFISFLRRQPSCFCGNVVKAMGKREKRLPYVAKLFERELARLNPDATAGA